VIHRESQNGRATERDIGDLDHLANLVSGSEHEPVAILGPLAPGLALGVRLGERAGAQVEERESDADRERASQHRPPWLSAAHRRSSRELVAHRLSGIAVATAAITTPRGLSEKSPGDVKTRGAGDS